MAGKYAQPIADQANTRATFLTDEQGNVNPTIAISGTVNTVGGTGQATVNVAAGFITAVVSGTVTSIGGAAAATVNVADGFIGINNIPTVNVGNTVTSIVSGTVTTVGGSGQATVNVNDGRLTATVNLGSIGTINIGNTVSIGNIPTVNLGSQITATVNLGSIGTINVGNTHAVTVTGNVTATANLGTIPTVNLGSQITATVNLGSIGTINVGNTVTLVSASANPSHGQGKVLQYGTIIQTVATTSQLVAGTSGNKVKLVSYAFTLAATGSARFHSSAALSGDFDLLPYAGIVAIGQPAAPLLETVASGALLLVATGGAAKGHFSYIVEA